MNPTPPDRPRFSWLEGWPLATALYLLLVVVATWPVAQVFTERFAGDPYGGLLEACVGGTGGCGIR